MRGRPHPLRTHPLWWLAQAGLVLMAGLFLVFGIQLLMAAYGLPDPFSFIMTFFAASLIILISVALLVGFLLRLLSVYRYLKAPPPEASASATQNTPASGDDERRAESPER